MAAKAVMAKKKAMKRLTSAQAKMAAKALASKGKFPTPKLKTTAKFTPPGFDAEDAIDGGIDEAKEK